MEKILPYFLLLLILSTISTNLYGKAFDTTQSSDITLTAENSNRLGTTLLKMIGDSLPGKNFMISPYSLYTALSLLYGSADGSTEKSMRGVLCPNHNDRTILNTHIRKYHDIFNQSSLPYTLRICNSFWGNKHVRFDESYVNTARLFFDADIQSVDFSKSSAVKAINNWISKKTNKKIKHAVTDIPPNSVSVLVNTVYFNALWSDKFKTNDTHDNTFFLSDGSQQIVPMMSQTGKFNYYGDSSIQAIQMNYISIPLGDSNQAHKDEQIPDAYNELSMIIILPRRIEGFDQFLDTFNITQLYHIIDHTDYLKGIVSIPRFTFDSDLEMRPFLMKAGLSDVFDIQKSDFSRMTLDKQPMNVDLVKHNTYINVTENGTEAAASTVIQLAGTGVFPDFFDFNANHPFFFVIMDNRTRLILFMGVLNNPLGKKVKDADKAVFVPADMSVSNYNDSLQNIKLNVDRNIRNIKLYIGDYWKYTVSDSILVYINIHRNPDMDINWMIDEVCSGLMDTISGCFTEPVKRTCPVRGKIKLEFTITADHQIAVMKITKNDFALNYDFCLTVKLTEFNKNLSNKFYLEELMTDEPVTLDLTLIRYRYSDLIIDDVLK